MKKLLFIIVFSLGGLMVFAQDTAPTQEKTKEQAVSAQEDYSEIAIDELPGMVTAAIKKNFPKAKIHKAYINEDRQYKLEIAREDGASETLFLNKEGAFIDE